MISQRELITVCRQIGGMMEAGVDILRITRVLRAQTKNERLLEFYQTLDHDLRMGQSISEALGRAPDVFSPFAASLVRQGEARNDLAGAFLKIADFLQQEEDVPLAPPRSVPAQSQSASPVFSAAPTFDVSALREWMTTLARDALFAAAGLLLIGALVSGAGAANLLSARWIVPVWCALSGAFLSVMLLMLARRLRKNADSGATNEMLAPSEAVPANPDWNPPHPQPEPDVSESEAQNETFGMVFAATPTGNNGAQNHSTRLPRAKRSNPASQEADYE